MTDGRHRGAGPDTLVRPTNRRPRLKPRHVLAAALVALLLGAVAGWVSRTPAVAASAAAPARAVEQARVVDVPAGGLVTVDTAAGRDTVRIVGITAPDPGGCGWDRSNRHARDALLGQTVALVDDLEVPARDQQGRRQAHVVDRDQRSYSDTAIRAGVARADTDPSWYRTVYVDEDRAAAGDGTGLWGPGGCWSADR